MLTRALLVAAALAGPALAAEPRIYRLSPAAIEAAKAEASLQPERSARLPRQAADAPPTRLGSEAAPDGRDRRIHGEAGIFIGSGGARGVFGTALLPLGDSGSAVMSFESSRLPTAPRRQRGPL